MNGARSGPDRRAALGSSGLLLLGGIVVVVGAVAGTAHTYDGSAAGSATGAVWTVVLPSIVAVAVSALAVWTRWASRGLALCAGAGLIAAARLISDWSVLIDPDTAVRPELYYELSDRAQPFSGAGGAVVMLVGDALMVLAGALAGWRLTDRLSLRTEPVLDPPGETDDGSAPGPEVLARVWAAGPVVAAVHPGSSTVEPAGTAGDAPALRNNWLTAAGFIAVVLLLGASLVLPYTGGYLGDRYLPPELGPVGIAAALATALLATTAVLAAAVLPRDLASALLGGAALSAAVPFLTAIGVRLEDAPVRLTAAAPVGLVGALVLACAARLGRTRAPVYDYEVPSRAAVSRANLAGAALAVLTCAAAAIGWRLPQLRYNSGPDPVLPGGYPISAPLAAPFLFAAIVPLVGAVLWSVPSTAAVGRAVATVAWLPLLFATTRSLHLLGQVVSSASVPNAGFAAPKWTAGPGLWVAVGGVVLGAASSTVSVVAGRTAHEVSPIMAADGSLDRARTLGRVIAAGLSLVVLVAFALPVYRGGSTLLVGFGVDSWGVVALAAGALVAVFAGGGATRASVAASYPLAAAVLVGVRLVIPAATRSSAGFAPAAGWYAGWLSIVLLGVAAGAMVLTRRGTGDGLPARPARANRPRATLTSPPAQRGNQRPGGRRQSSGASSAKARKGRPS